MNATQEFFEKRDALLKRFGLKDGQYFNICKLQNQTWALDGFIFGHGDLREEDIIRINFEVRTGEQFYGCNEESKKKKIVITHNRVSYHTSI